MRSRVMSKQSPTLTFNNESKSHNEFELWFLLHPSLVHLNNQITLTEQLMDETMLDANISVLNARIPHTSNGIAPFRPVEPAIKQHLDMHHEHVMNTSMMMDSEAITKSRDMMMVTSPESTDLHVLFVHIYFPNHSNS
jgi:hypothetical protein